MKISKTLREEIKKAILMGKSSDWAYDSDSDEEKEYEYFEEDVATEYVCSLLKKNIIATDRFSILEEMKETLKEYITVHTAKHPEATPQLIQEAIQWFNSKYKF